MMEKIEIRKPELYRFYDETEGQLCDGFRQEWYPTKWQRLSGCGPTNAASLLYYLNAREQDAATKQGGAVMSSGEALALMQRVWRYVKPTMHGIPSTELFIKGLRAYETAYDFPLHIESLNVPGDRRQRPSLEEVGSFVADELREDRPVAFLNLHNGSEPQLDAWHWVTITALSDDGAGTLHIEILDDGLVKQVNLTQWLLTTRLGGGFVRLRREAE